jgi:signal transduction histidine kinase/CheY-like chemotaxis protein
MGQYAEGQVTSPEALVKRVKNGRAGGDGMGTVERGPESNLEELRCQLMRRLTLLLMGTSGVAMWLTTLQYPWPMKWFGLLCVPLSLGIAVWMLGNIRPALARHLLVWGLIGLLLAAMWLFSEPWLPFLGLLSAFVGAMLVSGSELASAGIVAALAVWLTLGGARLYPLPGLLSALALGAASGWLAVRTLYTALEWAWTTQQRADCLLELARDRQGELNRVLKSLNVTSGLLHRTQRELAVAYRQAEEARQMKERFAANISHELRTPLNLILGFSELMYLTPQVYGEMRWAPRLRRAVHQIYCSSRHLLEMIDDILDLSRFEMVGFTLDKEPTVLEPLLRDTVEIAEDLFRDRPVRLEVEISPDLPPLKVDRTRIRQILLNVLKNAARFTEEGMVRVEAKPVDGEVVISVSDTGPGIPADELPHIFDEFYQVDHSLRRGHGGVGLGLAICKFFVEAHAGRIWVESQEGMGSTFFFTLPIPGQHMPLSRLEMDRPLGPICPEMHSPVLVVDPDPALVTMIRRHIEDYDVVQVEDVGRLAEEAMRHHPRAVVRNVPPGKQNGYDRVPSLPVPFIECSLPSQAWIADDLAVVTCLTKPITARQLLREIERLGNVHDVLVIDDDRGFCQLVEQMLSATGRAFEVRHAFDGADGLQAMRVGRPDLLLLDLVMPGVDGFRVLEEMRHEPELADVHVVLLTATSYFEDALSQCGTQVVIHRSDGLRPAEVLRCLRAVIDVLEPRYVEWSALNDTLAMRDT